MTSEDKRQQPRVAVDLWVEVERAGELYFQRASNLSVGGVYFTQTIPLPLGSQVDLRFTLPGDTTPIVCRGEIVNTKDLGMGVRFMDLPDSDRVRVEALIERQEHAPQAR